MGRVTPAVIVPRRRDHGWRDTLWQWCEQRWVDLGYTVVTGHDEGPHPFNAAAAFNRAARTATQAAHADVLILMGADHIPDAQAADQGVQAAHRHGWAPLFAATHGVTQADTRRVLAGRLPPHRVKPAQTAPFCTALLAVRADVWAEIGGMDERFNGWGCEDVALRMVLETLYPDPPPPTLGVFALWHEAAPRDHFDTNAALLGEYIAAGGNPTAMRELIKRLKEK